MATDIQDYLASFRALLSRRAAAVALLDASFYAFVFALSKLVGALARLWAGTLTAGLGALTDPAQQAAAKWLAVKLLLFVLAFVLLIIAAWLVTRGLVWARVAGKRYDWSFAWRFAAMGTAWALILAVPAAYLFKGLYRSVQYGPTPATQAYYYYHFAFFLLALYLSYLMNHLFTRHGRVFATFKDTARQAVLGFPRIIVPFVLMTATLVVLGLVSLLFNYLPAVLSTVLSGVMFFGFFAWSRMYYHAALTRKLAGAKPGAHKAGMAAKKRKPI